MKVSIRGCKTTDIIGFTLWYLGNLCVDFVDACDVDIQACKDDF